MPGGVWLLKGDDEALLGEAITSLVHQLVGDGDRSLMVDEFSGEGEVIGALIDAARTPPFLTESRIVVGRGVEGWTAEQIAPLLSYLADPLSSTALVLAAAGGRLPKALTDAIKGAGGQTSSTDAPSRARERQGWVDEQLADTGLHLDATAKALLVDQLGEDLSRLSSIVDTLLATFGPRTRLHADDVRPFLGDAGSVPTWDLTDAIDSGDTARALANLSRLVRGGERHPLQILATLHGHYTRMLRLDGAGVADEKEAAQLLGLKNSTFPARKALDQGRRLGHDGVARAVALLADADLDVRGAKEWSDELVLEVLVARLSRLSPMARSARR